jgi:hypothetical protein
MSKPFRVSSKEFREMHNHAGDLGTVTAKDLGVQPDEKKHIKEQLRGLGFHMAEAFGIQFAKAKKTIDFWIRQQELSGKL